MEQEVQIYQCEMCKNKFEGLRTLKKYCLPDPEAKFACQECGYGLNDYKELKSHKNSVH